MNTVKDLYEVFAKAFAVPVEDISDALEYQAIPEWDSVSHLVLVSEIEATWNISIATEDILDMGSVEKVREMLKRYGVEFVA